jgi:hypothetical protein
MGAITLTVEGTTVGTVATGGGVHIVKSVSEQDSARLLTAFARLYGSKLGPSPTYSQIIDAWWEGVVAESVAKVLQVEKQIAAEQAANAVTPIAVS